MPNLCILLCTNRMPDCRLTRKPLSFLLSFVGYFDVFPKIFQYRPKVYKAAFQGCSSAAFKIQTFDLSLRSSCIFYILYISQMTYFIPYQNTQSKGQ